MTSLNNHSLRHMALIALVGVCVVALGEWLMLYAPTGGYGAVAGHQNFLYPSVNRLQWGFFLAVLSAPVYPLVYYVIAHALQLPHQWRTFVVGLAVFGFSVGNVWLGTNAYLAIMVQATAAGVPVSEVQYQIEQLSGPLLQIVRVVVLFLSLISMTVILRGKTLYPRWAILTTPLVIIPLIFVLYVAVPLVGNLLLPAALNIAHIIFMFVTVYVLYKTQSPQR